MAKDTRLSTDTCRILQEGLKKATVLNKVKLLVMWAQLGWQRVTMCIMNFWDSAWEKYYNPMSVKLPRAMPMERREHLRFLAQLNSFKDKLPGLESKNTMLASNESFGHHTHHKGTKASRHHAYRHKRHSGHEHEMALHQKREIAPQT